MKSEIEETLIWFAAKSPVKDGKLIYVKENLDYATAKLEQLLPDITKVDRFEVIDDTGRAYIKGSIYGSPVKIELSYQDEGRTLKVFVEDRLNKEGK